MICTVKAYTSPTSFQNPLAMSLLCSQAKSITTWANTTKPSRSRLARAARSRQRLVTTTRANTLKPSFVRLSPPGHTGTPTNMHCLPAKAIDRYIVQRSEEVLTGTKIDPRLQSIIESIFQRCIDEGEYRQVHFTLVSNHKLLLIVLPTGDRHRARVSPPRRNFSNLRHHS
jgi:hypothetical protein